jgi:hypothetical protein
VVTVIDAGVWWCYHARGLGTRKRRQKQRNGVEEAGKTTGLVIVVISRADYYTCSVFSLLVWKAR